MAETPLDLGRYDVALECPDCGDHVVVTVELTTVRTTATDEPSHVRLKAHSKKTIHSCGQTRLDLIVGEGRGDD